MSNAHLYFVHAYSPLHAGVGQGVGVIDLPIARERATNIPIIPGSTVKGVLRDACEGEATQKPHTVAVFGPPTTEAALHAGALAVSDAHLLLLPVRSLAGTFAWVTSPFILRRLARDAEDGDSQPAPDVKGSPSLSDAQVGCWTAPGKESLLKVQAGNEFRIYLEELDLVPMSGGNAKDWAAWLAARVWPGNSAMLAMLSERICIVHDDVMGYLLEAATEVRARVRIDDATKTVAQGQLWYEEMLPAESILSGLMLATSSSRVSADVVFATVKALIVKGLQVGGKETVGRGFCRISLPGVAQPAVTQGAVP